MEKQIIYYERFKRNQHFTPAPGLNCPVFMLRQPDYEIVKVTGTSGGKVKHLKGRKVMISWGLNIPVPQFGKYEQVLALPHRHAEWAEIVLAIC